MNQDLFQGVLFRLACLMISNVNRFCFSVTAFAALGRLSIIVHGVPRKTKPDADGETYPEMPEWIWSGPVKKIIRRRTGRNFKRWPDTVRSEKRSVNGDVTI